MGGIQSGIFFYPFQKFIEVFDIVHDFEFKSLQIQRWTREILLQDKITHFNLLEAKEIWKI